MYWIHSKNIDCNVNHSNITITYLSAKNKLRKTFLIEIIFNSKFVMLIVLL